jgi:hypothetical protein
MAEFDFSTIAQYLQPSEEDRQRALKSSLMVAGLGMLANNQGHYGALGPALGAGGLMGMQNYTGALEQAGKAREKSLQQGLALEKMKRDMAARDAFSKMYSPPPSPSPFPQTGGVMPAPPTGSMAPASGSAGPTLEQIGQLMAIDPNMGKAALELWKAQNPGMQVADGFAFNPRTLPPGFVPQMKVTPQGTAVQVSPNQQGQPEITVPKGAAEAARTFADVGERSKAALDMIQVPDGRGGTRMMTRESAATMLGIQEPPQAPAPAPSAAPAPTIEPSSGRLTVVAPDDKTAERWMRQFESQGIPATVKVAPKARKGNPAPITEPIAAPPIRTAGGPPRTDELLGYTPPKEKEPPKDFRWKEDGTAEPIPGGPADTSKKDAARADAARSKANIVINKVDEALKQTGWQSTGIVGAALGKIPATKAFDLERTIDTLKSNLGFSELQAMREASPTGGALGQVAIQELAMLQSTIASLDKGQSEPQLKKNLEAVAKHFTNWKNAVEQSAGSPMEPEAPKPPARSRSEILKAYGL